jgi:4-amino-4-deoxy-L-arabinose transferase-like glycosyltransferase
VLPRLVVLVHERGAILSSFTEKSDTFAWNFVHYGTYGLVPGEPSAYTQPLYGWFLIPIYWIFGRHWWAVGGAQIGLAVVTAQLVFRVGLQFLAQRTAAVAAAVATLNPYLIWHDVHVNREIVDQVLAAAIVLVTLKAASRRSWRLAAVDGVLLGLAILGNTRLVVLPIAVAAYLLWRWRSPVPVVAVLALAAVAVAPWMIRNRVDLGCWAVTTDARALWKANNPATYRTLASGQWIDNVPNPPNAPYTPEAAGDVWKQTGRDIYKARGRLHVDECAQMRHYRHLVIEFWEHQPHEKAKLMAQATSMLWDPRASETTNRPGAGSRIDTVRRWGEGVYMSIVYALAIAGIFVLPRAVAALVLLLLAYQTAAAAVFAGTTRYRVVTDFLLVLTAAAAVAWLRQRRAAAR